MGGTQRLAPDDLRIRHVEPDDHAAFAETMLSPKAQAGTLQLPLTSKESWRERISKIEPGAVVLVAEVRRDGAWEIVANAGMFPLGPAMRRRHAMTLGMAVRDDWQGRGIGSALMQALVDRADRWMNVLRLELTVYVDNAVGIALYRRFGFVVEGTHRAYALRDGLYVDAYAMARLHPAQPRLPESSRESS